MAASYASFDLDRSQDSAEAWDASYALLDALDDVPCPDDSDTSLDAELDWLDHLADLPINPRIVR